MDPTEESPQIGATGSLSRRMIGIAALWITLLLIGGGVALDRLLTDAVTRSFDEGLNYVLTAMISSAELGPDGEVRLIRPLADQRFLEPNSGIYFQISGKGFDDFRSLYRRVRGLQADDEHKELRTQVYDRKQLPSETLRVMERTVSRSWSKVAWRFMVAQARASLDQQIAVLRTTLIKSFAILSVG